jgi:hypothetical protein
MVREIRRDVVSGLDLEDFTEKVEDFGEVARRAWRSWEPSVWGSGRRLNRNRDKAMVVKYLRVSA